METNAIEVDGPVGTNVTGGSKRTETKRSIHRQPCHQNQKKGTRKGQRYGNTTFKKKMNLVNAIASTVGVEIGCDSKTVGTSPMKAHIGRCKMFKDFEDREKQKILGSDNTGNMKVIKYDPVSFRKSVNEIIVVNELPFPFVESEGFRRFCLNVVPIYQPFSRKTCASDIKLLFEKEKEALVHMFKTEKQRVSLTTDIWVSPITSYNYMVVTSHWIDRQWKMQKRILSFKVITDHRGETIAGQLADVMGEWGIEKVFTVTVDNASANTKGLRHFRDHMKQLGECSLVLGGELLHIRCCAHILSLIVGDGLKKSSPSITAIRNGIKYVRSSFARLKSFQLRCETRKVSRGSLPLDVVTRWNSTYLMLSSALKVGPTFERMLREDMPYNAYFSEDDEKTNRKRVGPPTSEDWEEVRRLVKFLKIFYNSTLTFSASTTVTSSLCYNEILNIERNLMTKCTNSDEGIRSQTYAMRDKFEKYWDGLLNMNPLVILASVFDPRNKMQFASLCFDQLYGKDTIESRQLYNMVLGVAKKLYEEYSTRLSTPLALQFDEHATEDLNHKAATPRPLNDQSDDDDDYERMDTIYSKMVNLRRTEDGCSELDIYLTEKTELQVVNSLGLPYDVLDWWKCNSSKFPVLSELARDVLAIQMSSVASESCFSTSGRVLDPYRSSLTPYMVEVLVCTQQWLRCGYKDADSIANLSQMLEEAEFFESLDARNNLASTEGSPSTQTSG